MTTRTGIRKFSWYIRDLAKRRVVLMCDRRAVRLVHATGSGPDDLVTVEPNRGGKSFVVRAKDLYEPREPEAIYCYDFILD